MKKILSVLCALTLILSVFAAVPFTASADVKIPEIHLGETLTLSISNSYDTAYVRFLPEENMTVAFTGYGEDDIYACLYSDGFEETLVDSAYAMGNGLRYDVKAGEVYYFGASYHFMNDSTESFSVGLERFEYNDIHIGDTVTVGKESAEFRFIPDRDMKIWFGDKGINKSMVYLNDSDWYTLVCDQGTLSYDVKANETYYFVANCSWSGETVDITLSDKQDEIKTGTTGDCIWTLDGTELTISGNGAMGSYSYADWGTDITKATIENGVTSIGCSAFKDCAGLTSVTIPASVTSISNWAFEGCTGLTSITVPGSVTSIGYVALGYYYDYNIGDFRRINSFTIRGYTGSTAEEYAEENGIAFVSIGKMPPRTGTTGDCTWTLDGTELTISGKGAMDDYYNDSKPWGTKITKVTIKNGVTSIGDYAFFDCDMLTSISIPDSVEHIGRYALHNTAWYDNLSDGVVYAGRVAYSLKGDYTGELTLKAGTVSISPGAFNWSDVTRATIPDSVKEIGYRAFYNCNDLLEITIGSGVREIGYWAFYNCDRLTTVTIPESVTEIGDCAFGFYYNPIHYTDFGRIANFTIYGRPGSAAEQYANDNGFPFRQYTKPIQFATPKVTKVQNTVNGVSFAWSKSEGAAKYRVFRKSGSGSFAKLVDTTALTYVDQTAKSGTTYTYTVRCISADGKTYTSDYDKTGKSILYIAQPKITKLENTANGVKVTCGKVNGAAKYRIFRKSGSGSFAKLVDTAALTYVDKTAKSGTKYAYTVRCISKDGKSYTSSYDTVGKSILYLAQPKITKFENVANGIKLTLSKSTGAASYKVFIKSGKAWKALATVKTNTYTYTKVKSGTTYAFTVRAVSKDGKTLSAYNTTGWKQKFVASPALPTLKNTKKGIQVTLKKVAGAEKYRIFRKVGNGKFAKLADTTSLKYVDKTAKNGKTYYYTICCISKNGKTITSAYNTKGKVIKCKR